MKERTALGKFFEKPAVAIVLLRPLFLDYARLFLVYYVPRY